MRYLLDTNVWSELMRKKPDVNLLRWIKSTPEDALYISVIVIGEIEKGILKTTDDARRILLRTWFEHEILDAYQDNIIPIDSDIAKKWGYLLAHKTRPITDMFLAATCLVHDFTLVTRNTKDFEFIDGLIILNPFISSQQMVK